MTHGQTELEWLMEYELNSAIRHRRFMSLVLIADCEGCQRFRLLQNLIRKSDEFFIMGAEAAILMSETGKIGALRAIDRFKEAHQGEFDLRFAVAAYPRDGDSGAVLLQTAQRRLNMATLAAAFTVVGSG